MGILSYKGILSYVEFVLGDFVLGYFVPNPYGKHSYDDLTKSLKIYFAPVTLTPFQTYMKLD